MSLIRCTARALGRRLAVLPKYRCVTTGHSLRNIAINTRHFATTGHNYDEQSANLKDLLDSELKFEQRDSVGLEKFHQEWLNSSGFQIVKQEDPKEVNLELLKETKDEIIHVQFNPLEVTNIPLDSDYLKKPPPEDDVSDFEQEETTQNMQNLFDETIANVTVIIEKKGLTSGLYINLLLSVQTNYFAIGGLRKYDDIKSTLKTSAQDEFQRELYYYGPPFTNLDENLQESLMEYLNSRGIDNSLADFITGYSLVKENELYISWLSDLKSFF